MVLPHALVRGTRDYLERITNQVNGCYEHGWFDGCAVMMRRLIETLIIEAFEHHGIAHKIRNPAGDFLYLADLVAATLHESTWNLGRNAKKALPRLKEIGDQSAHSRRFVAHREGHRYSTGRLSDGHPGARILGRPQIAVTGRGDR
jgi:hypothetical protein